MHAWREWRGKDGKFVRKVDGTVGVNSKAKTNFCLVLKTQRQQINPWRSVVLWPSAGTECNTVPASVGKVMGGGEDCRRLIWVC